MSRPDSESGGGQDERDVVRVPPPDDQDEQVRLYVFCEEAGVLASLKEGKLQAWVRGLRLRHSRSVTAAVTRGGLLIAGTAITFNYLPGQRLLVVLVALMLSPAVIGGPGALTSRR